MPILIYFLIVIIVVVFLWWLISLIWGKPWSINHFYTRVFLELLFDNRRY